MKYWDKRVDTFGEERSYTNLGVASMAATEEDLYVIQLKWMALLSQHDDHQRSVMYTNSYKYTSKCGKNSVVRKRKD